MRNFKTLHQDSQLLNEEMGKMAVDALNIAFECASNCLPIFEDVEADIKSFYKRLNSLDGTHDTSDLLDCIAVASRIIAELDESDSRREEISRLAKERAEKEIGAHFRNTHIFKSLSAD